MAAKKKADGAKPGASKKRPKSDPHQPEPPPIKPPAPVEPVTGRDENEPSVFPIVGVGASAGGLEAFKKFLRAIPVNSGMAFILVPHLDPKHESLMVELLARQTAMKVIEAAEGEVIKVNHVYVIPPNKFLTISAGRLLLSVPPEPRGRRTALDTFFRSLALDQEERAIGIVLSGTGSHGTTGIKEIKMAGGMAIVQQPESADYSQMPESAIATGVVDFVLTPEQMPEVLLQYARQPYVNNIPYNGASPDVLNRVLVLVKASTRYDFRSYRKNMLLRRIQRRMGLWHLEQMSAYVDLISDNRDEVVALCKDLLIGVTGFFRDPAAFQVLEQRVIPEIVSRKGSEGTVRVWVPGCSSGEEAYSIAILVIEQVTAAKLATNIQIFATDIDEESLSIARRGIYPESALGDISADRHRLFFGRIDDQNQQVTKRLRDTVVFAPQNLISDAPFSRLDLISCRNLLIYLEPEVQKKVISLFHFSLDSGGYLMLGPSETVGRQISLFEPISSRWRVYQRSGPTRRHIVQTTVETSFSPRSAREVADHASVASANLADLMHRQLVADYAPASVLINPKFEVLCFQGPTVDYLEFPSGEPTRDLLELARQGLRTRLRAMITRAIGMNETVTDVISRVKREGRYFTCQVTVKPMGEPRKQGELLLVTFADRPDPPLGAPSRPETVPESALIGQLENELRATREDLQGTIEELETSNEEMKASNEEMMSMNEELQSVNEELETSKEELQSTNEELITVNSQISQKIVELNDLNNDISNLLNSTDIPTIFLTIDFRIRRFTPSAVKLIHLLATDLGRPIGDVTRKFTNDLLLEDCKSMLDTRTAVEREVRSESNLTYLRRVLPYLTAEQRLEGIVVAYLDITDRKLAADLVDEARLYAEGIVANVRVPLVVLDASLHVRSANPSFFRTFSDRPSDVLDEPVSSLQGGTWITPPLQQALQEVLVGATELVDFEVVRPVPEKGDRTMLLNARMIPSLGQRPRLMLLSIEDISDRKHAELELKALNLTLEDRVARRTAEAEARAEELARSTRDLRESEARLRAIVTTAPEAIITIDEQGLIESCNPAAERMFDYSSVAIIGQKIELLIPWFDFEWNRESLARYLSVQDPAAHTLEREVIGRRRDGLTFPIDLALSEFHDGSRHLFTGIMHDVSERKSLQHELLSIADAEQRRIGQDLHDDIGQELTGLAMKAETLSEIVAERMIPERELAVDIVSGLDRTRSKVRTLSRGMVPVEIDANGLVAALDELTVRMGAVHKITCTFVCQDRSIEFDTDRATQLYHIAQEAITNALKHAHARNIVVGLEATKSAITLSVSDDGIGITEQARRKDGMGLRIMSYRAGLVQGKLEVAPVKNGGTRVSCALMRATGQ